MEHDETESGGGQSVGRAVAAAELGLTSEDWDNSIPTRGNITTTLQHQGVLGV